MLEVNLIFVLLKKYVQSIIEILGLYINQSPGLQGLSSWVNEDQSIEDKDIVLYHSFGIIQIASFLSRFFIDNLFLCQALHTYQELRIFQLCLSSKIIILFLNYSIIRKFRFFFCRSFGYTLKPLNFFKANPGLSVPPPCKSANKSNLVEADVISK